VTSLPCPIDLDEGSKIDHVEWVRVLDDGEKRELKSWLKQVGESIWRT
jgi:hypothetical protein